MATTTKEYPFPVPSHLLKCKGLHGRNQRVAVAYMYFRMSFNPRWTFNAVELSTVLGIHRTNAWRLLQSFTKKGIVKDLGNKRIDIPAQLQAHGLTHYFVHEFQGVWQVIFAFMCPEQVSKANTQAEKWNEYSRQADIIWAPYNAWEKRFFSEVKKMLASFPLLQLDKETFEALVQTLTPIIGARPDQMALRAECRAAFKKIYQSERQHDEST